MRKGFGAGKQQTEACDNMIKINLLLQITVFDEILNSMLMLMFHLWNCSSKSFFFMNRFQVLCFIYISDILRLLLFIPEIHLTFKNYISCQKKSQCLLGCFKLLVSQIARNKKPFLGSRSQGETANNFQGLELCLEFLNLLI